MVTNFNDISAFLKESYVKDLKSVPENYFKVLEEIRSTLHQKVDEAKDRLIDYGTRTFQKEDKDFGSQMSLEDDSKKDVKTKVHDLVASLDMMLKRTEHIDESIKQLKEEKLEKLIVSSKGEINFRMFRKFKKAVDGKSLVELNWAKTQNKSQSSHINTSDETELIVHANCCYNYYQTDKTFTEDNIVVEFLVKDCTKTDQYFYFGVSNETNQPDSHCMCCSPVSVTYFNCNGYVYRNGSSTVESKLTHSGGERRIRVRLMCSEKSVYFQLNDNDECGPYKLTGTRFKIVSGSCNSLNGTIKIDDSSYY